MSMDRSSLPRLPRRFALVLGLCASSAASVFACGAGSDNLPPPPPPPPAPAASIDAGAPGVPLVPTSPETAPKPAMPPVTLAPGAPSPDPTPPLPTVSIVAPTRDQAIPSERASDFSVRLDVKGWQTAPGSSHVHLILDNKPYKAIYDTKQPIKLSELTGGEALSEGRHVLVAFPSRANHESVKTKGALALVPFWVGKRGDTKDDPTKKPMLIYSRPKGEYLGELANHVLIDPYVANFVPAAGKEHVKVTVTGPGIDAPLSAKIETFGTPLYLDNLGSGTFEITIELIDASNKRLEGPWGSTTRTIKVDRTATASASAAHGDHANAAPPAEGRARDAGTKAPQAPPKGGK